MKGCVYICRLCALVAIGLSYSVEGGCPYLKPKPFESASDYEVGHFSPLNMQISILQNVLSM